MAQFDTFERLFESRWVTGVAAAGYGVLGVVATYPAVLLFLLVGGFVFGYGHELGMGDLEMGPLELILWFAVIVAVAEAVLVYRGLQAMGSGLSRLLVVGLGVALGGTTLLWGCGLLVLSGVDLVVSPDLPSTPWGGICFYVIFWGSLIVGVGSGLGAWGVGIVGLYRNWFGEWSGKQSEGRGNGESEGRRSGKRSDGRRDGGAD